MNNYIDIDIYTSTVCLAVWATQFHSIASIEKKKKTEPTGTWFHFAPGIWIWKLETGYHPVQLSCESQATILYMYVYIFH